MPSSSHSCASIRGAAFLASITTICGAALAQPSFTPRDISLTAVGAQSVFAVDVDGDGDTDVLSASRLDDAIRWYESDGATPPTFTPHDIFLTANGASSIFAADVDGDGHTDILSSSLFDDAIRWYENNGATPPTFTPHDISLSADLASSVFAADVDGDGHTDVLSTSVLDDAVRWYENDGATPPTFTPHDISLTADGATRVFAADVDGDGHTDVLSASYSDDAIRWYENDGATPLTFTHHDISLTVDGASVVFAADVDGDGHTDVLSASEVDDAIRWFENDGATPPSFTPHDISLTVDGASSVCTADVDGDGHTDVLSAAFSGNEIRWYESDGATPPSFTPHDISLTANGASSVFAADIDGNGHTDVLTSSVNDNTVRWYEGVPACRADITTQNAPVGDPNYGMPDGLVTGADIQFYVNAWFAPDAGIADITTQNAPLGDPNYGVPDGLVTGADIQFYVNLWFAGCP